MINLTFIVGVTAVGKTDWALELAKLIHSNKKISTGILNADSIQIYKDLNIGSAKPDKSCYPDINFYLFDELSAPQIGTAGFFRDKSLKILHKKLPKEKIFIVGGSGFYLQALEKGMYPIESENRISQSKKISNINKLNLKDKKKLYQILEKKDPLTAKNISPNDSYRIQRALYLINKEDKKLSQIKKDFKKQTLPWSYRKIGLKIPKEQLLKRVKQRTQSMLKKGLIEETESLIKKGLKNWKPLSSIGYNEVLLYLDGQIKKEDLESMIVAKTMKLAKKQTTWFKKDTTIQWFDWNLSPLKVYKQFFK
ncbi:MAG: tRNA (adenosine(37)-N6)-dimethylallyltransferase MiaA [Bdellovibrionaceae bacterium]|nr:tRNA (adenosine(37)-N6)-dimethylallyltransferase MiaA [Pseudobdellovibrionaceae bacterium]